MRSVFQVQIDARHKDDAGRVDERRRVGLKDWTGLKGRKVDSPVEAMDDPGTDHRINPFALAVWTLRSSSPFVPPLIARVRPSRSSASALAFSDRSAQ